MNIDRLPELLEAATPAAKFKFATETQADYELVRLLRTAAPELLALEAERDRLLAKLEQREQDSTRIRDERDQLRFEFYQRERKVERLIAAGRGMKSDLSARAGDAARGAISVYEWDKAVADLQADQPPPVARDPIPDTQLGPRPLRF